MSFDDFVDGWQQLFEELKRFVEGLLARYGRPTHHAEDILQQAFVNALERVRFCEIDQARFRRFAFWWVRTRFVDWLRSEIPRENNERQCGREQAQRRSAGQVDAAEGRLDQAASREALRRAIAGAGLTPLEQQALTAWLESCGDRHQAAASMGISDPNEDSTYDQAKFRALKKLSLALADLQDLIDDVGYDQIVSLLMADFDDHHD